MDHRAFLSSLDADEKLKLQRLSTGKGVAHLLGHLAVIGVLGAYIVLSLPFWQIVLLPYGTAVIFLFTLEHECTHATPFASKQLNEWVGRICGFILILPFEWFRYFHLAHHKFTNDPESDPELAGPRPDNWPAMIVYVSGLPYWRSMIRQTLINAFSTPTDHFLPAKSLPRIRRGARLMVLAYGLAGVSLFFSDVLVWLWLVPILIGQPFLRLYLLAEHGRCPPVANMFENTRTTFTNRLLRFLAWNMPYHAEHHAFPSVPFWQLPEFHRLALNELKVTSNGYASFTKSYVSEFERAQ